MNKTLRKYCYQWASFCFGNKTYEPDTSTQIDVVIPVIEKDLDILPLCLEGVRNCVPHPILNTYIVAPATPRILDFCSQNGLLFIDETKVLGYGPKDIDYCVNGTNRSGWIFQQLLKLSGRIGTASHFLVIDADHILIRPHTFLDTEGHTVFYQSKEFYPPYYRKLETLLGKEYHETLSYVDHKILFSHEWLEKMQQHLEKRFGMAWDKVILQHLDTDEISCFSEYETYGTYFPKEKKHLLPWRNKNLTYDKRESFKQLQAKYGKHYRAITFPEYLNR